MAGSGFHLLNFVSYLLSSSTDGRELTGSLMGHLTQKMICNVFGATYSNPLPKSWMSGRCAAPAPCLYSVALQFRCILIHTGHLLKDRCSARIHCGGCKSNLETFLLPGELQAFTIGAVKEVALTVFALSVGGCLWIQTNPRLATRKVIAFPMNMWCIFFWYADKLLSCFSLAIYFSHYFALVQNCTS